MQKVLFVSELIIRGNSEKVIIDKISANWNISKEDARKYIEKSRENLLANLYQSKEEIRAFLSNARLSYYQSLLKFRDELNANQTMDLDRKSLAFFRLNNQITKALEDIYMHNQIFSA